MEETRSEGGGGREKRERELAKMCCEKEKEWVFSSACVLERKREEERVRESEREREREISAEFGNVEMTFVPAEVLFSKPASKSSIRDQNQNQNFLLDEKRNPVEELNLSE